MSKQSDKAPNIFGMRAAKRIESILEQRGITKSELAKNTDISTGNLGDWKRGKSAPGAIALSALSKYLGVSVDWLLSEDEELPAKGLREDKLSYFFEDKMQFNCNLDELTEDEKKFVKEYIAFTKYRRQMETE